MADTDKAYIGIEPCGCVTFVMAAGAESARSERAELKKVLKDGRRVDVGAETARLVQSARA